MLLDNLDKDIIDMPITRKSAEVCRSESGSPPKFSLEFMGNASKNNIVNFYEYDGHPIA